MPRQVLVFWFFTKKCKQSKKFAAKMMHFEQNIVGITLQPKLYLYILGLTYSTFIQVEQKKQFIFSIYVCKETEGNELAFHVVQPYKILQFYNLDVTIMKP